MNKDLKKIIETSTLILHKEDYVYAKVKTVPLGDKHFLVTRDSNEITVITKKENIGDLDLIEKSNDRALLEIQFSPDAPDAVGFLAVVSSALAKRGISISVISTYSKDYILVAKKDADLAVKILTALGLSK